MNDYEDNLIPFAEVGECGARLRRVLARAGMVSRFNGKHKWILDASRAIQPVFSLPWPLSIFQPKLLELRIYDRKDTIGVEPVYRQTFKESQTEEAIAAFLQGSTPTDQVMFVLS